MSTARMPAVLEPDDLHRMPDADLYELIDGVPTEKPTGVKSSRVATRLASLLDHHCVKTGCGVTFGETSYRGCFPGKPQQLRRPDISFVATNRLPAGELPSGDFTIAPDLIAESVSPGDSYEEVLDRVADFQSAKTRLIWVISPRTKSVLIRRADGSCAEIHESDELSGEDVIPGFTRKVAELFV